MENSLYWRQYETVIVVKTSYGNGDLVEVLKWQNMRFEIAMKYKWYFKYRAALLQIKYPKYYVTINENSYEATGLTKIQLENRSLNKKIINVKKMITKFSNAINNYNNQQLNTMFPNYECERYKRTKSKLLEYKNQLKILENQKLAKADL